jgi:uncharacterized damage-inducible protein DinB
MLLTNNGGGERLSVTLAEQRLNSNHGRLVHAANNVPAHLREARAPDSAWTARDVLAHVLAWQEEAVRRFGEPQVRYLTRQEIDDWNAVAHEQMREVAWDEILARIEAAHVRLKAHLSEEPPSWFAACTYRHYTEHTRSLLALAASPAGASPASPQRLSAAS